MKFAKIFTLILIISSFVPIVQIIFLYANGGILSVVQKAIGSDSPVISIILNLLLSAIFIFFYYNSKKLSLKIMNAIIISFFITSFLFLLNIEFYGNEEGKFYFLQFLLASIMIGSILLTSEYIKRFKKTYR